MNTKNLKRPVLPAIFLLLSIVGVIVYCAINMGIQKFPLDIEQGGKYLLTMAHHLLIILFACIGLATAIILFLKKKNILLAISVGAFVLFPVYLLLASVIDGVISVLDSFLSPAMITGENPYFIASSIISSSANIIGAFAFFAAMAALLLTVILAINKKHNRKLKISFVPAIIYILSFLLSGVSILTTWVFRTVCLMKFAEQYYRLNELFGDNKFKESYSLLEAAVESIEPIEIVLLIAVLISSAFFLIFLFTLGAWLRDPYIKGQKSAEVTDAAPEDDREKAVVNNE